MRNETTCDLDFYANARLFLVHLCFILLHLDACFHVPPSVHGAHERVCDQRFSLMDVIGTVVVYQTPQTGC